MAELDIKDIWKKGSASLSSADDLDVDQIISQKSKTVLTKIRFILKIEFWLNNILVPATAVYYFMNFGFWYGVLGVACFAIYFTYFRFLIGAIDKFDYTDDVKHGLTKVYKYLNFYLLHYKVVIWLSFVGIFWGFFIYGYYLGATGQTSSLIMEDAPKFEFSKSQAYLVIAMVIIIPVAIASGFHYLINLLYGRKIKKLKQIISDFD